MSGTNSKTKTTPRIIAGRVKAYFQRRSHHRCIKNKITNIALAAETAIIAAQPLEGVSIKCELAIQNDVSVSAQSIRKIVTKNGLRFNDRWLVPFFAVAELSVAVSIFKTNISTGIERSKLYQQSANTGQRFLLFTALLVQCHRNEAQESDDSNQHVQTMKPGQ